MKDVALIFHFIGLAMGVGTSFGFLFLGFVAAKLEPSERGDFMKKALGLIKMAYVGLSLLVLSGIYLLSLQWGHILHCLLFQIKIGLVLVLIGLVLSIGSKAKKIQNNEEGVNLKDVKFLGRMALMTGVFIISLAVMVFH